MGRWKWEESQILGRYLGNEDLKSKFPKLFSLSNYKDANIDSFGVWTNGS